MTEIGIFGYKDGKIINYPRIFKENRAGGYRTDFARDRDRIIHSKAFRRLKGKTQVFHFAHHDHVRNRLTHTLEVSQIGRSIANALQVNEELVEVICLSHDLGHPPFGHIGEDAINHCLNQYQGYNHNIQTLKYVTKIENTYPSFNGLNLSLPVIDGIIKHDGKISDRLLENEYVNKIIGQYGIDILNYGSIEAQIAGMSDQIAYNHHDLDDGFRSGIISLEQFLDEVSYAKNIYNDIVNVYGKIDKTILANEIIRTSITNFIIDGVENTKKIINKNNINNIESVYSFENCIVSLSDEMLETSKEIYKFLFNNLYRSDVLMDERHLCFDYVVKLFEYYNNNYDNIDILDKGVNNCKNRAYKIADYISGMTDSYAYNQFMEYCNE